MSARAATPAPSSLRQQPEYRPLRDRDDFKRLQSDWKQRRTSAVQ